MRRSSGPVSFRAREAELRRVPVSDGSRTHRNPPVRVHPARAFPVPPPRQVPTESDAWSRPHSGAKQLSRRRREAGRGPSQIRGLKAKLQYAAVPLRKPRCHTSDSVRHPRRSPRGLCQQPAFCHRAGGSKSASVRRVCNGAFRGRSSRKPCISRSFSRRSLRGWKENRP